MKSPYARHYPGHYYAAPIPLAPIPSDAGSSGLLTTVAATN